MNSNNYSPYRNQPQKPKDNTGVLVAISILAVVIIIGIIFITLMATGVIDFDKSNNQTVQEQAIVNTQSEQEKQTPVYDNSGATNDAPAPPPPSYQAPPKSSGQSSSSSSSSGSQSSTVKYRVRKSASDASSQVGAYAELDNAIKEADSHKNEGYKVYDTNGKLVYAPTVTSSGSQSNSDVKYRVRKSASDSSSQVGAYASIDNAIKEADSRKSDGYKVYDMNGNVVYTP